MDPILLFALFALAPSPEPAPGEAAAASDRRCYSLMAQLAEAEDPHLRSAGMVGAQYFLGRIDADATRPAPEAAHSADISAASELLQQCAALMGANRRDFRLLGERLARGPTGA